jgi:hypothetical protein
MGIFAAPLHAQIPVTNDKLQLTSKVASTWTEGRTTVILVDGEVNIELDRIKMSAKQAVIWITPVSIRNLEIQEAQIALFGDAKIQQGSAIRSGEPLFASAQVRGDGILIHAPDRNAHDASDTPLYKQALALRALQGAATRQADEGAADVIPIGPIAGSTTRPQTRPAKRPNGSNEPVEFFSGHLETVQADDGTIAAVLTGGVQLIQRRETGDYIELQADRAVLFTSLHSLKDLTDPQQRNKQMSQSIIGAYLEGDVRIHYTPNRKGVGEQRLNTDKVYYEFGTDRAVMTMAIVHTVEPAHQTTIVARAKLMRQLSIGEYRADHMQLSTSSFAVPSISIAADRMYLREEPNSNPLIGNEVAYQGQGITFQAFDVPFFWMPASSGTLQKGLPLRALEFGDAHDFGYFGKTEWGLFETLGTLPPRDLDVNYRVDYFSERGPAAGLNGAYGGGFLTDTAKTPWDFTGDFHSYFVYDQGTDDLGRLPIPNSGGERLRGEALWEHQHFFPDHWSAQVRAGWVSDATFLEQWFRRDFEQGPPHNEMAYIKHQDQTETFSADVEWQPNRLVTTSGQQQEQFEVERLPEFRYDQIGVPLAKNNLTFFSQNEAAGLRFQVSRSSLQAQGFNPPTVSPGLPALGTTGIDNDITWRGDTRQEIDWPMSVGPIRVVPYVFGRYTQYSNSPTGSTPARFFAGAGTRMTTEIWKTDPTARSDLFDIHQLRHVIEPEVNLFTSATNIDNTQVFIYDQAIDKINDVSAAQFALHQRWQTKRGGPGEWRSVDAFSLNVDVDFFANKPPKSVREPVNFRGIYLPYMPEASTPRDAINADAAWRVSDNTVVLADTAYNIDKREVDTIGLGVLLRRGERLSAFIGNRYLADLDSNITSIAMNYELTSKYTIAFGQQFDFSQGQNVQSNVSIQRHFDTFIFSATYYFDEITGENGFSVNLYPIGLGQALDTGSLQTFRR